MAAQHHNDATASRPAHDGRLSTAGAEPVDVTKLFIAEGWEWHKVGPDDSLRGFASERLHSRRRWGEISRENADILGSHPDNIHQRDVTQIRVPKLEQSSPSSAQPRPVSPNGDAPPVAGWVKHTVTRDDSFHRLAGQIFGDTSRWREIAVANKALLGQRWDDMHQKGVTEIWVPPGKEAAVMRSADRRPVTEDVPLPLPAPHAIRPPQRLEGRTDRQQTPGAPQPLGEPLPNHGEGATKLPEPVPPAARLDDKAEGADRIFSLDSSEDDLRRLNLPSDLPESDRNLALATLMRLHATAFMARGLNTAEAKLKDIDATARAEDNAEFTRINKQLDDLTAKTTTMITYTPDQLRARMIEDGRVKENATAQDLEQLRDLYVKAYREVEQQLTDKLLKQDPVKEQMREHDRTTWRGYRDGWMTRYQSQMKVAKQNLDQLVKKRPDVAYALYASDVHQWLTLNAPAADWPIPDMPTQ